MSQFLSLEDFPLICPLTLKTNVFWIKQLKPSACNYLIWKQTDLSKPQVSWYYSDSWADDWISADLHTCYGGDHTATWGWHPQKVQLVLHLTWADKIKMWNNVVVFCHTKMKQVLWTLIWNFLYGVATFTTLKIEPLSFIKSSSWTDGPHQFLIGQQG